VNNKNYNVAIPTLGMVNINFRGMSLNVIDLFEKTDEFNRQKRIKHLGLISKVFEGSSHSRYDYVMLQCALVDLVDNIHKGSPTLSLGELKVDGIRMSGNELLKSWFLLSNFGHTRYTFGDEKAITLYALKTPAFKRKLLKPILDTSLKTWGEEIIIQCDYTKMHYLLAVRRIYKETSRNIKLREQLIALVKLLVLQKSDIKFRINFEKLEQLKRLFNLIRKLSIISIDGHYSHMPVKIDLIASIVSLGTIEKTYSNQSLVNQLNPIISLLHEEIYLNKEVLEWQRSYEVESHLILSKFRTSGIENLIEIAFQKGLIENPEKKLSHFARLKLDNLLKFEEDIKSNLDELAKIRIGCRDTEYGIDYNPIAKFQVIDLFLNEDKFENDYLPLFIFNICNYISKVSIVTLEKTMPSIDQFSNKILQVNNDIVDPLQLNKLLDEAKKVAVLEYNSSRASDMSLLYKEILWSLLRFLIKDKFIWDVNIQTKSYPQFVYSTGENEINLKSVFDLAISEEVDKDRAFEIFQLKKSATRHFEGIILACLARITIYDITKAPSERIVTDIDSLLIKVNKENLVVEFHESKNTRNAENKAKKDLKDKFVKVLNNNAKGYRIKEVKGMGAKLVVSIKKK